MLHKQGVLIGLPIVYYQQFKAYCAEAKVKILNFPLRIMTTVWQCQLRHKCKTMLVEICKYNQESKVFLHFIIRIDALFLSLLYNGNKMF